MLHVERRRGSSPDRPDPHRLLTLQYTAGWLLQRWPLAWSVIHLTGSTLGGWAADFLRPLPVLVSYAPFVRVAALAPLLAVGRNPMRTAALWGTVLVLSFLAGAQETQERRGRAAAVAEKPWTVAHECVATGGASVRTTGWAAGGNRGTWRAPARLLAWVGPDSSGLHPRLGDGLLLRGEGPLPVPGSLLSGRVTVRTPPRAAVPAGFDYRGFLAGRGLRWTAQLESNGTAAQTDILEIAGRRVVAPVRRAILAELAKLYPVREAGLSGAVLLGRRTRESREAAAPFADLGLAHLFSVSGLHVGILLGMILLPGRWLALQPGAKLLPLVMILPLYVVLTGMPGSVVRAAGLGWLAACAVWAGRRSDALHLVGCLFWLGSLWDPWQNLDTGLRLSYLAAGGILALASTAERNGLLGDGRGKWISGGVLVSLAAQWFTLPVVACSFGRISLLSPLANLLAVPLFGVALWLVVLSLVLSPVCAWLAGAIAAWAWLILRALSGAVQWASAATGGATLGLPVPGPVRISLLVALTTVALLVVHGRWLGTWSSRRRLAVVLLLLLAGFVGIAPWTPGRRPAADCWIFDVGQGDCVMLRLGDGWTALIDTAGRFGRRADADGPFSRSILPFLHRQRIGRIDALILTHNHLDHTGGLGAALESLEVGRIYCGGRSERSVARVDSTREWCDPQPGDSIHRWRDWEVRVLYGAVDVPDEMQENNRSTVVGLVHGDRTVALFSGDLEFEGEALWARRSGFPQGVEVWKAGHHGSNTSGSPELLEAIRPQLTVVSCGTGNGYGHPNHGPYLAGQDTLLIRRTDLDGTVRINWHADGNRTVRRYGAASSRGRLDTVPGRF